MKSFLHYKTSTNIWVDTYITPRCNIINGTSFQKLNRNSPSPLVAEISRPAYHLRDLLAIYLSTPIIQPLPFSYYHLTVHWHGIACCISFPKYMNVLLFCKTALSRLRDNRLGFLSEFAALYVPLLCTFIHYPFVHLGLSAFPLGVWVSILG